MNFCKKFNGLMLLAAHHQLLLYNRRNKILNNSMFQKTKNSTFCC